MTHKYKSSYKSHRNVKRFAVSFSGQAEPQAVKPCSICGGVVEQQPMLRDVCYTCYRDVVELQPDPRIIAAQLGTTAEVMTDKSNWMDEAEADAADYADLKATEDSQIRDGYSSVTWWNSIKPMEF